MVLSCQFSLLKLVRWNLRSGWPGIFSPHCLGKISLNITLSAPGIRMFSSLGGGSRSYSWIQLEPRPYFLTSFQVVLSSALGSWLTHMHWSGLTLQVSDILSAGAESSLLAPLIACLAIPAAHPQMSSHPPQIVFRAFPSLSQSPFFSPET